MKHFYILCLLFITSLLFHPSTGMAQTGGSDAEIKDRIRAAEIAYLAQKLDLTPEEAQKFWPVYNQYTKEVELLIAERNRTNTNNNNAASAAPERTASREKGSNNPELKYDQRMLDIKNHYDKEFQKVLPATKAGSVFRSEREFRNVLMRQLKERQARNMGGPAGRRFRN